MTEPMLVNERKFVGHSRMYPFVASLLAARCIPDGAHPCGEVHSIYLDSVTCAAYDEKANGDNLKMKVRLRWYGEAPVASDGTSRAFFELKYRVGSARDKLRSEIRLPKSWISTVDLSDSELSDFLHRTARALGLPVPVSWEPVICIVYDRMRYVCPVTGSRVSIDWNIRVPRTNGRLFAQMPPIELPVTLCEFKNYGGEPPPWAEALFDAGFRLESFSKYGECMGRIKGAVLS